MRSVLGFVTKATILAAMAMGCSPQTYLAVMPGVLNDPSNRTLRREILAFGTGSLCKELMKRSAPLKLLDDDPTIGRFYPRQCNIETLENGDLYVQFSGTGYAWSNLTKRIGFNANAAIEYDQDFKLDGSTMYIYFRPRATTAKRFELIMTEASLLPGLPVLPGGSPQGFTNQIGEGLLAHELGRGFTVIRESDGTASFSLGLLAPGEKPAEPYVRTQDNRLLHMNERLEIHQGQRDFAGPFEVPDSGQALFLTMVVEGAPSVDVLVYHRAVGDQWLATYIGSAQAGPPPGPALMDEVLGAAPAPPPTQAGFMPNMPPLQPTPWRRMVRLQKGAYYVVIDNTKTAGRSSPPEVALDDRAALVSLAVELGSAP